MMNVENLARSLEEVQAHARGETKLKVTEIRPPRVDVKRIRASLGDVSQKEFARRYGLSLAAVRNWEQGLREPEGPARTLLALIERNPEFILREVEKLSNGEKVAA
ncbi:MAG: helix-turn-helix domain-containing protein [Burkholderiales bacterium]